MEDSDYIKELEIEARLKALMNESQLRSIHRRFLNDCAIDCGPGWFRILDWLATRIKALNDKCVATQIKEKFGTLRVYVDGGTDEIFDAIMQAEVSSASTCEECGAPGTFNKTKWIEVRCNDHKSHRDKE